MSASLTVLGVQTHRRFRITLFIRTKNNMRIFGVMPFIELQTTLKQQLNSEKNMKIRWTAKRVILLG